MSGGSLFIDTNIILYLLNGDETLSKLLQDKKIYISFISELEVLGFKQLHQTEEDVIHDFLKSCTIIDINQQIKDKTVELRQQKIMKLPDCIVAATASILNLTLVSADKGFSKWEQGLDFILYSAE